jgi:hypothetical protein
MHIALRGVTDLRPSGNTLKSYKKKFDVDLLLLGTQEDEGLAIFEDACKVHQYCGLPFDESVKFFRVQIPSIMEAEDILVKAGLHVASYRRVNSRDVVRIVKPAGKDMMYE